MASITLTVGALTVTKTISSSDMARLTAAFKARYGEELTNQEAFNVWSNGTFQALIDLVQAEEEADAIEAAKATIVPIAIT